MALTDEFTDRVTFTRGKNVIGRLIALNHEPHAFDIVTCVTPVSLGVEVSKVETVLLSHLDTHHGSRDFTRHEGVAAARRFVIEKNAIGQVHAVRLAVVDDHPVGVLLCDAVRRAGVEGCGFRLRNSLYLAVELGSRSLVEAARLLQASRANGVEQTKCARACRVEAWHGSYTRQNGIPSTSAVYSDISNDTLTCDMAPRL